ncbi:MAG: PAS domain S-box protein [Phycisphaerae bacterium]|nr:PAS domain S-box protein [Phycisphaerae bacterium]
MAGFGVQESTAQGAQLHEAARLPSQRIPPFPIRSLIACLAVTALLFAALAWHLWTSYRGVQKTLEEDFSIQRLSGVVVHLDEVLTMSARMAAATGDPQWERRYRVYEPQLDAALKDVMRLASEALTRDAVSRTNAANLRLIEMENKAFSLVRDGRRDEAAAVFTGREYEDQKQDYSQGMKEITTVLQDRAAASLHGRRRELYLGFVVGLATLTIVVMIWVSVLRGVRRHIAERRRAERELERHREHLAELVEERTTQLTIANEELARHARDLAQAEARYRDLFENAPDLMAVLEAPSGQVLECNTTLVGALGLRKEDIVGRPFLDLYTPECRAPAADTFAAFVQTGHVSNAERTLRRADGSLLEVLVQASPIRDGSGRIIAGRCTWRDVTRLKQAEREVARQVAALARSNAELEEFAYVASHDLQEPLRKILAFGDRLKATCAEGLPGQGPDYMGRMLNAARRMQTLIDDLLTFSRVTTQARPHVSVDLNEVLGEVLSDLEVRIEQSEAQVEVSALPTVQADPTQMRQLFQNLVGNALKFRRREVSPRIRIWAESVGVMSRISVEDNGIGFEEKYAERIFGIFQRLHGRGEYEGTGIGLAVCQKIVKRHGGEIVARGAPDRGATFIVSLPIEHGGSST